MCIPHAGLSSWFNSSILSPLFVHCIVYFCLVICLDLIICVNLEKGNDDDDDDDDDDESTPITLTIVLYIENGLLNM